MSSSASTTACFIASNSIGLLSCIESVGKLIR